MVSVVIALYNGEMYIEKTIHSVLNQTIQDFEIIVVDDCSTDNSLIKVKELAKQNDKIKVVENKVNSGFCATANRGIAIGTGDLLLVIGQDDILEPNHIETMLPFFDNESIAGVYCDCRLIDELDNYLSKNIEIKKDSLHVSDFIYYNAMSSCGLILRKSIVDEIGGYPEFDEFPQYGEWYLWIKVAEKGQLIKCKNLLANYRRHSNNLTNTFKDADKKKNLEKYWNMCRVQAIKSKKTAGVYKLKGVKFFVENWCKNKIKGCRRKMK